MTIQKISIVNSVGPTSGDFLNNYLDPRDDPSNYPNGLVVITLTAQDATFSEANFLAEQGMNHTVLATALAAINTGYQVLADVDWPPQDLGEGFYGAVYCHSLWLNKG
jgi:hypothetical protein